MFHVEHVPICGVKQTSEILVRSRSCRFATPRSTKIGAPPREMHLLKIKHLAPVFGADIMSLRLATKDENAPADSPP
jgi:hypothetical protein